MRKLLIFLFILISSFSYSLSYEVQNITNFEGLSNSSINVIFQDSSSMMWFGTWDGLNMYNSKSIKVFKPSIDDKTSISNHIIRGIIQTNKNTLWIATDLGVNKLNIEENTFESFFDTSSNREATGEHSFLIAKNSNNQIVVSVNMQGLYYYNVEETKFEPLFNTEEYDTKKILFDSIGDLWLHTKDKLLYKLSIDFSSSIPKVNSINNFSLIKNIKSIFQGQSSELIIQSDNNDLFSYSIVNDQLKKILSNSLFSQAVNALHIDDDIVYIGTSNGLYAFNIKDDLLVEILSNISVLSFYKGTQDVLWAGTDMKGVIKVVPSKNNFQNYTSDQIPEFSKSAVRAFIENGQNDVWVATKGSGILIFRKNKIAKELVFDRILTTQDGISSNSVYKLTKDIDNVIWIGTDGKGINYYDNKTNKIKNLQLPKEIQLSSVYEIFNDANNTLWIGTSGYGMYKLVIDRLSDPYKVVDYKQYIYSSNESSLSNNIVYSIVKSSDNHLWIGTRGGGVNKFNIKSELFELLHLSNDETYKPNEDVLSLMVSKNDNLYIGTSLGLYRVEFQNNEDHLIQHFTENDGIPNNTIHGVLQDQNNAIWISTNKGIAKIQIKKDDAIIIPYYVDDGLQNNEFSDGAYYTNPTATSLYFGGINGFNLFNPLEIDQNDYIPDLWLDAFIVDNVERNLKDFLHQKKGKKVLQLAYDNSSFGFRFIPIDFVRNYKNEISYMLDGFHSEWINIGSSNTIVFSNLPSGNYQLKVRCSNSDRIWSDDIFTMPIKILPPWWASTLAFVIYSILLLVILFVIFKFLLYRRNIEKEIQKQELNRKITSEVHQAKLNFFTNIAHEFSNSLTLIYGPCDKLLNENEGNGSTKKYLQIIKSNSLRMQSLIEELVEFRKAETGHLKLEIENVDIVELVQYTADNFIDVLENKNINLIINFTPNKISFNTDRNGIEKILFNLISNAIKYTPTNEDIVVNLSKENNSLNISIKNTGVGIKESQMNLIFNRFEVLNRFEKNVSSGKYYGHGIGLSLCKSISNMLGGDITVNSDGESYVEFHVVIPNHKVTSPLETEIESLRIENKLDATPPEKESITQSPDFSYQDNQNKKDLILLIEDEPDLRMMIKDMLKSKYEIQEAENGIEALEIMEKNLPVLVLSDIMMPLLNGFELLKKIKEDKRTSHIPVILISSKGDIESKIEGIEIGADAYLKKPFNIRHLEALIVNLLNKKETLKDFSNSIYASMEFFEGKDIYIEDKNFVMEVACLIHNNIDNENLTLDFIASEMMVSKMQLYRKIKEVANQTPTEFIRSIRLKHAEHLLKTTKKTVLEIIYLSGFNNKSYFYREFSKKNQLTPTEFRNRDD